MKYRFLSLLLGLFAFPLLTQAAVGDNCSSDLLKNFSPESDWRTATVLEALDGSVWRRGVVSLPQAVLLLAEGESSTITATVSPSSEAQIFIFTPEESDTGRLLPPATGTCFETASADATGKIEFGINARILWGALDEQLVIDIFYRLDEQQQTPPTNAQNSLQIGSYSLPHKFDVRIDTDKHDQIEQKGKVIIRDKNFAQSNDMLLYQRGSLNGQDLTGVGWNDAGCQTFCDGLIQQGVFLDPKALPQEWHGNNFVGLEDAALLIARAPGPHTFYTKIYDSNAEIDQTVRHNLTRKALYMEALKRALLGNPYVNGAMPALTILDDRQLRVVASGRGGYSERTIQLVKNIRYLMLDPTLREPAARFLANSIQDADVILTEEFGAGWEMSQALLEIFPEGVSNSDTWGEDLVRLLEFWTASSLENVCLMLNDSAFGQNFRQVDFGFSYCDMDYALGKTPTLLVHTNEPLSLKPNFTAAEITYADRFFDTDGSFAFASGKKAPLYYRYRFSAPFDDYLNGDICITQSHLPRLIDTIATKFELASSEVAVLSRELYTAWQADSDDFVHLRIADPSAIAQRFRWLGNDNPLDLLQLFFSLETNACSAAIIQLPDLAPDSDRAGFEVGILR